MIINSKKQLLTLMLSAPIALFTTSIQAVDHTDDWKSMPATSCESHNNGLTYGNNSITGAWGWVRANKATMAQCPMVRDNRSARPARFRVSFYHSGNQTTNCRVNLLNRNADTGLAGVSVPLNASGSGYLQRTINFNTTYQWGHVHLTCDMDPNAHILSYALHEL